jgi:3-methylcrotonyl-CoA carboxylase alpha subunit
MPIQKLLIANRGEIAVRIMRTCRALGIATVAVYSDADRDALHVREADEAIRIGPAPAAESYLNIPAVIAAAQTSGADAVHPGYGFLSENAAFAQAVLDAGLTWVGPTPEAIRRLGSKIEAKRLARAADVPTVPGYWSEDGPGDPAQLAHEADRIGYPVLIKASAGGGGKGMRVVRDPAEFGPALEGAQREAQAAFGDATVFVERYVEQPRHIEIQIIGDTHGTVLHLGERECSIQRRHQKVLEESPSPAPQMTPAKRAEMGAHAVALAQAAGYTNAGTVEFIMDAAGNHYFLEVNTRLQVEHPVTEAVTGIDLVAWQLLVAQGDPLPATQADIHQNGHAIEVRIYAEDALKGFLPSTGRITRWRTPYRMKARLDSGVEEGSQVSIYYDPMLAKLIAHGTNRAAAVQELARTLARFRVQGVTTNLGFLLWVAQHPEFRAGNTDTGFIDRYWHPAQEPPPDHIAVAAAAADLLFDVGDWDKPYNPWHSTPTILAQQELTLTLDYIPPGYNADPGQTREVRVTAQREAETAKTWRLQSGAFSAPVTIEEADRKHVRFGTATAEGQQWTEAGIDWLSGDEGFNFLILRGDDYTYRFLRPSPLSTDTLATAVRLPHENSLEAPMPGKVIQVLVGEGEAVEENARLVVMEAMKMELTIRAPHAGRVTRLPVGVGQLVDAGTVLVEIE